jgi:hypothetical protein
MVGEGQRTVGEVDRGKQWKYGRTDRHRTLNLYTLPQC